MEVAKVDYRDMTNVSVVVERVYLKIKIRIASNVTIVKAVAKDIMKALFVVSVKVAAGILKKKIVMKMTSSKKSRMMTRLREISRLVERVVVPVFVKVVNNFKLTVVIEILQGNISPKLDIRSQSSS